MDKLVTTADCSSHLPFLALGLQRLRLVLRSGVEVRLLTDGRCAVSRTLLVVVEQRCRNDEPLNPFLTRSQRENIPECHVHLLSQMATDPFSHLNRHWISMLLLMRSKQYFAIMSDSSRVTPSIRPKKPLLTYIDFHPVTAEDGPQLLLAQLRRRRAGGKGEA